VTKQDAKVGEVVTSGAKIISIISDNSLEIESNVSEISIGKVSIGNKVEIRFDAFPEKIYMGKVSYIEPAETIIDGVVNYKTTVNFDEYFPEIKSGLTSKLDIITATREDSLIIPQYAITEKSDGQYVSKLNGRNYLDQKVEIGIRGQDGSVEVLSGLNEGDTVLVGNSSI
jgi:membrane fusion protein (multidrug efflux system)